MKPEPLPAIRRRILAFPLLSEQTLFLPEPWLLSVQVAGHADGSALSAKGDVHALREVTICSHVSVCRRTPGMQARKRLNFRPENVSHTVLISVEHETSYHYECAVTLQPHTFRLRPRMTTTQRVLAFDLQILPTPAGSAESLDQDGNLAQVAWFFTPTSEMRVISRFQAELLRTNPFDFQLTEAPQRLALWYPSPLEEALGSYRHSDTVDNGVRKFAASVAAEAKWNLMEFLTALNRQIFERFSHINRPEGCAWSSSHTLARSEGSCRDLAVLFCDACRIMGIAARFVSGYECASAGLENASMHAWAEVFVPAAGWRGYDPSRGLAVADGHVAVAAAFDSSLAAPVAGVYSGACVSHMDTRLRLRVE